MKSLILSLALTLGFAANAEVLRDVSQYNLQNGVGFKAHDPVSTHTGEKAIEGKDELALEYKEVIYKFSSIENQEVFLNDPALYEPSYGGWCAYAMALGSLVDIDPNISLVVDGRTHYFVSRRALRNFERDVAGFIARADANWEEVSGEKPPQN